MLGLSTTGTREGVCCVQPGRIRTRRDRCHVRSVLDLKEEKSPRWLEPETRQSVEVSHCSADKCIIESQIQKNEQHFHDFYWVNRYWYLKYTVLQVTHWHWNQNRLLEKPYVGVKYCLLYTSTPYSIAASSDVTPETLCYYVEGIHSKFVTKYKYKIKIRWTKWLFFDEKKHTQLWYRGQRAWHFWSYLPQLLLI